MDAIQLLDWDTRFFGFPIAKVTNPTASIDELREVHRLMAVRQIPLAYWAADNPSEDVRRDILELGGRLVDEKLTYLATVHSSSDIEPPQTDFAQSYRDGMSIDDLKRLAVDSGVYSRFIVDPQFPRDKARAMFEEWMLRSLDKTPDGDVLVILQSNRIAGMATVVQKEGFVSIGLVAVAEEFRGRGFGETLVRAAMAWCYERDCHQIQVTTQSANEPARRLYQRCGFGLLKTEFIYHIWCEAT